MKSPTGYARVGIGLPRLLPVFALGLWVFAIQPAAADEPHPAQAGKSRQNCAEPASPGAPQGSAGLRVYVDPQTGKLAAPPAGAPPASVPPEGRRPDRVPPPRPEFSTSGEGLVEIVDPVPGRGVTVDLQGRFRSSLTATVGPEGKATIRHETRCPDGADSKR